MIAVLDRPLHQKHIRDLNGTVTNELLLELMKAMRAEIAALAARIKELRETHAGVGALHRDQAGDAEVDATLAVRVDRISDLVDTIE